MDDERGTLGGEKKKECPRRKDDDDDDAPSTPHVPTQAKGPKSIIDREAQVLPRTSL
jgi:hypothetical protein